MALIIQLLNNLLYLSNYLLGLLISDIFSANNQFINKTQLNNFTNLQDIQFIDTHMSDSDDFQDCQQLTLPPNSTFEETMLFNIRKFISQPNPLLQKIEFSSYNPQQYFPTKFNQLPMILMSDALHADPNNINSIDQSVFTHDKLKRDVLKALLGKGIQSDNTYKSYPTLQQFYQGKTPIYEKYSQSKFTNHFATLIFDLNMLVKKESLTSQIFKAAPQQTSAGFIKNSIEFSSNFQSGNLFQVYQKSYNQYDLILQNDINTKGNNQWFFFSVKNAPKNSMIKFNLINLTKQRSLFEDGLKPTVFSMNRYEKRKIGWVREGMKVSYDQNNFAKRQNDSPYYTLSFTYKFIYEGDIVYFSHSFPYTYSNLSDFLNKWLAKKQLFNSIKFKNISTTLGKNEVDMLQISNQQAMKNSEKKIIWIIGRQHPGQITSSFMVQGIIEYLLSKSEISQQLVKNFIFKIVPMVNVDGVIHGNSRAQIIGSDPNRKWDCPSKLYNPIVWNIKKAIQRDQGRIVMILDLHSHSRKLGTFFYGNIINNVYQRNQTKKFPYLVCRADQRFNFDSCRFGNGNPKTARRVLFSSVNVPLTYTVESSFYGYQKKDNQMKDHKIIPYYPKDYRQMGQTILETFYSYSVQKHLLPKNEHSVKYFTPLQQLSYENELAQKLQQLQKESVGSDENPSQDEFTQKQLKKMFPKTFSIKKKSSKKRAVSKTTKKLQKRADKEDLINKQDINSKLKKMEKQSYYKKYFSGKDSQNFNQASLEPINKIQKEIVSIGVQIQLDEICVLKGFNSANYSTFFNEKKNNNNLCIFGKKVDDDIHISGRNIGIQANLAKQFTMNRNQLSKKNVKMSITSRPASILNIKENNFLNRGNCGHTMSLPRTQRRQRL